MLTRRFHLPRNQLTKSEKLLNILHDYAWHATKELSHRVGHTFGGFIFKLRRNGYAIEREKHPLKRYQHQYRLTDEPPF
jgi:hypothetical protein